MSSGVNLVLKMLKLVQNDAGHVDDVKDKESWLSPNITNRWQALQMAGTKDAQRHPDGPRSQHFTLALPWQPSRFPAPPARHAGKAAAVAAAAVWAHPGLWGSRRGLWRCCSSEAVSGQSGSPGLEESQKRGTTSRKLAVGTSKWSPTH